MGSATIAIIFDFDDTLGPDTISFFLKQQGKDPESFWNEVKEKVREGFDPPFAYMHLLMELAKKGKIDLSKQSLQKIGKRVPLFPGLPHAFEELRSSSPALEFYIVSGGLEEMIRGNPISKHVNGIFASNFSYDTSLKIPTAIKSAVSFTEKTRFVFGINKGLTEKSMRSDPYRINDAILKDSRRVPFEHMIYIGDGPSDIPCLSLITTNGGTGIGVSAESETFRKGYELARGKRLTVGPYTANFSIGSDLRKVLEETLLRIGLEIAEAARKKVIKAPSQS